MTSGSISIIRQLSGARDVALGDDTAPSRMDLSADAFWHSVAGLALSAAIDAALLAWQGLPSSENDIEPAWSLVPGIFVIILIALSSYLASLVLLYVLLSDEAHKRRFPVAIIVSNWLAPIASFVAIPLFVVGSSLPSDPSEPSILFFLVFLATIALLITIGIRALRISLQLSFKLAAGLFGVTTFSSILLQQWLQSLSGF